MIVNYIPTLYAIIRLRAIRLIKWFALYMALIWSVHTMILKEDKH